MRGYFFKRLLMVLPIMFGISVITFVALSLLPGDIVNILMTQMGTAPPEVAAQIRASLGIDKPLYLQYVDWLWKVLHGDFGLSFLTGKPVFEQILHRLPVTFELAALAISLSCIIGIPLGVASAIRPNSRLDNVLRFLSLSLISVPAFWIGMISILVFVSLFERWPTYGWVSPLEDPIANMKIMLLPSLALSFEGIGFATRITRTTMLEVLHADYIRAGRARGASERVVLFKHALRNALIPVITLMGLYAGALIGGAVIIEAVFSLPGLGDFVVYGAFLRDYAVVRGVVLFLAVNIVLLNLAIDMLYALLDPRIKYQ